MKKVSLIGVILSVLMVLTFTVPTFAFPLEDWDYSVSSSEDWVSNQPEADASSTQITITVKNDTDDWYEPAYGKARIDDFDVSKDMTVTGGTPTGWQTINRGNEKDFTWNVGVKPTTTDGNVNVNGDFDTKFGYFSWLMLNGSGVDADGNAVFGVDSTDPTIAITTSQTGGAVTVNVVAVDAVSGVRSVDLSVDGKPYSGVVGGVGNHTLNYTVTDKAGNKTVGEKDIRVCAWFAGNPNGTPHYSWKTGEILECAWLSSQFMKPGFYGWDYTTTPATMWGVLKDGTISRTK